MSLTGAICRYAASWPVTLSCKLREQHVENLQYQVKVMNDIHVKLESKDDFGKHYHTASSEPYFYKAAYEHVFHLVPINENDKENETRRQDI